MKLGTLAANGAAGFVINCPTIAFTQQEPVIDQVPLVAHRARVTVVAVDEHVARAHTISRS